MLSSSPEQHSVVRYMSMYCRAPKSFSLPTAGADPTKSDAVAVNAAGFDKNQKDTSQLSQRSDEQSKVKGWWTGILLGLVETSSVG